MVTPFHKNRYDSLQVLRAICAILIFTEHVPFLGYGLFGVDIFFCLSGFMMMLSTEENGDFFLRKRLIRLVPLYYILTFLTYFGTMLVPGAFEQTVASERFLLKSLLFIPFEITGGVIQPLVRVGWTLNAEIFFTLLFFLGIQVCKFLHLNQKYRFVFPMVVQSIICIIRYIFPWENTLLDFWGKAYMLNFIMGILVFFIARWIYNKCNGSLPVWVGCLLSLGCIAMFYRLITFRQFLSHEEYNIIRFWVFPCAALVLCFFVIGLSIKSWKPLVWIGNISYSFYLLHYYPTRFLDRFFFNFSEGGTKQMIGTILALCINLLVAAVSYYLIEKKLTSFLRKKLL